MGDFSWEGGTLPKNSYMRPMRSYPVKENLIVSAVSEILQYKHTHKHTDKKTNTQIDILLLYYKDSHDL